MSPAQDQLLRKRGQDVKPKKVAISTASCEQKESFGVMKYLVRQPLGQVIPEKATCAIIRKMLEARNLDTTGKKAVILGAKYSHCRRSRDKVVCK